MYIYHVKKKKTTKKKKKTTTKFGQIQESANFITFGQFFSPQYWMAGAFITDGQLSEYRIHLSGSHFDLYQSLNRLPIWNSQNCSMFPLAFVAGWLQGHWWGFISRNYVVWPTFFLMNVFIALKGSRFWFYISSFKYTRTVHVISSLLLELCDLRSGVFFLFFLFFYRWMIFYCP